MFNSVVWYFNSYFWFGFNLLYMQYNSFLYPWQEMINSWSMPFAKAFSESKDVNLYRVIICFS